MEKSLFRQVILFVFLSFAKNGSTQTTYSFSVATILNSMPNGTRLPDGTIVKAFKETTGTGAHQAESGMPGNSLGGTFNGTTIPAYVGNNIPLTFTRIAVTPPSIISGGISNNCQNSIAFRISFDRPTLKISFLAIDIDGTAGSTAEWTMAFGYNGNTFVPYIPTVDASTVLFNQTISTVDPHSWRTLIENTLGINAANNLPASLEIKVTNGPDGDPDEINKQVLYNPENDAPVTDFFLFAGIWPANAINTGIQRSGISPIVITVSPDFGDLPDTYQTLLISGGASHGVVGTLLLGATNTTEANGTPSLLADGHTDDDGITTVDILPNNGSTSQVISSYTLTSNFTNNTGLPANYAAWIDWNNNGTFEASEGVTANTAAGIVSGTVSFTWTNVTLSGPLGRASTYARIRVTTEPITTANIGGALKDGEVEDYLIPFAVVLPLKLISFSGKIENDHASLNWKTENESNTAGFEIQYSNDGTNFSRAGYVNAAGSGNNTYTFTDTRTVQQANYYRLKMMDMDRRTTYSSIIILRTKPGKNIELKISPNPVTSVLNVNIAYAEPLSLNIYDLKGQMVKKIETQASNFITIDCSALKGGSYYLKAVNKQGETQVTRFFKNNF